ncbi:MAG: hypothetical protein RLZZ628_1092 [Bacteroidota bacterium]|jgi:undecaprenyl pyrophosphate phosphatase UppP
MNTCRSNAELIVLKLCIATAYILIGTYFHSFFRHYYIPLLVVFVATVFWSLYLWYHKMRANETAESEKKIKS